MADTLLLNADAQPLSYLPLSTVSWKEAIVYMYLNKCTVLEWYDDWMVSSMKWETKVPAVIMLKDYVRQKSSVRFSKSNVFLRDQYFCLYCDCEVTRATGTLDHVLPQSKGGKTTWENIVTACGSCNAKKANKTIMKPKYKPYMPGYWELVRKKRQMDLNIAHPSWEKWIDYEKIS